MSTQPILVAGQWRAAALAREFRAEDPARRQLLDPAFPVSTWSDCNEALDEAVRAAEQMRETPPAQIARFLESYATQLDHHAALICETAAQETGLPVSPRLLDVELPRTTDQLRQAAGAAREGSWRMATIDTSANIRSALAPVGPVLVFGPNNFPLAFNGIAGGDFAAAVAAGNPVIAKAHSSHPRTTQLMAEHAVQAAQAAELPAGAIQMLYALNHEDGEKLVADPRLGGVGFTGSRGAGLRLKTAADAVGKPIYLELSSINPVVILPAAVEERGDAIIEELVGSCLLGTGQFCTCPNLILAFAGAATERLIARVVDEFRKRPIGTLLSRRVLSGLSESVAKLVKAGTKVLVGGQEADNSAYAFQNTLLCLGGDTFLRQPELLQTEPFGNATSIIVADDEQQALEILMQFEGSLTGTVYSAQDGRDEGAYERLAPVLRAKVGRLLNDKMPTGVAVSPAMNHGGPFPATGHPGFTAVGLPASIRRFTMLQCFDNVRPHRLPLYLQDKNPNGMMWRSVDGEWSRADIS